MNENDNVISIDSIPYNLERLKRSLKAKNIIVVTVNEDETFSSFIESSLEDIDFCYMIDCLKERRKLRSEYERE